MFRPFGLGPAVFAAILVVVLFILIGVAAGRLKGLTGVVGVTLLTAAAFSAITFWPTYQPGEPIHKQGPIDYLFLPRIALLVFLVAVLFKIFSEVIRHSLLDVTKVHPVGSRSAKNRITLRQ